MANAKPTQEELRAEIEAELRAKIAAEYAVKDALEKKALEEEKAALEAQIKKHEESLEAEARRQEKSIAQQLKEMKHVSIEIPEDPNNPDDVVPVGWQGVIYAIPRGQRFDVPEVIYEVWKESHERTKEVNKRIRESVTKEITVI